MSEHETIRAGILIFSQQLTETTFGGHNDDVDMFLTRFEAILGGIKLLTRGTFESSVKKTMLQGQLRHLSADWSWGRNASEFADMGYNEFKEALRKEFGRKMN